ncbi:hypothetical protein LTR48_000498 [Friedmanniomyces endolithicus]|uniref:Conidiation-specific protein 8 n=2 Tax=Dothideomycetidae TaxID=451867 RepID=A0A4V5N7K4_9PEZI|nr:hypothetical protein LTS09_007604 [Friedmanniomyces endolithicus]KAK5148236.1 hypothetical protein LTR32_000424 [Rachicladosporium monterosium]KAK0874617.1 hypothetical protein LTS02_000082 [Friedmanniomyces endolithicus]KAK0948593.1 hypothetical protein LTR29_000225 [Friedmanniomyces endolithicus]KAK1072207.1 hypothetical protein LTR74_002781 [Friedmanniomyces endolithicus]
MSTWEDRRGQFQKGKEVVPPPAEGRAFGTGVLETVRRASVSSANSLEKTPSGKASTGEPSSPTRSRRRSSNQGMFGNLQSHKRGSEDYSERRTSHGEMTGAPGGMFSGWYNATFRGYQTQQAKVDAQVPAVAKKESRKGVME